VEAALAARHLEVLAGDEAVLNHQSVGGVLANGEALAVDLVEQLVGTLLHAHLGGLEALVLVLPRLHVGAQAHAGRSLGLATAALAVHGAPLAQSEVGAVGQLAARHGLAGHEGALAGQILQQTAGAVVDKRHVLTAHLQIRDGDVTLLPAAEHHALALQSHPEHFLATAKEHQLRHVASLDAGALYLRDPQVRNPSSRAGGMCRRE
jgi:hypothetical protein